MSSTTLVFVSPQPVRFAGLPTRPTNLLTAFLDAGVFEEVVVVNRVRPTVFVRGSRGGRAVLGGGLLGITRQLETGARLIEHPWPFGRLERRFLRAILAGISRSTNKVVVWVADPKSVPAVVAPAGAHAWHVIMDAYDAWDLSPLVRGERRLRAVSAGYRAAAARADIVFANTVRMRDRIGALGARDARLLQNACPPVDERSTSAGLGTGHLVYVGRIHERFDAELARAVAIELPDATITIAGPVEREPIGWSAFANCSNVRLVGRVEARAARDMISAAAALIIPHRVDDYTRSQDAMKAWDAVASGTPVVSTSIPPADGWPTGLAQVCQDTTAFVTAARRAVEGRLEGGRAGRLDFAAENQWSARANVAIAAIGELTGTDGQANGTHSRGPS